MLQAALSKAQRVCKTSSRQASTQAFLNSFINHEKTGVPTAAGTGGPEGFKLDNMHQLLQLLQNPQNSMPVVHVAGTKGKGSTATLLASILSASGYKSGLYTSPHVMSIRERITIDLQPIQPESFDDLAGSHEEPIKELHGRLNNQLTHFEVLTALALQHFSDEKVDVAVVETGLGGISDATNVFQPPHLRLSMITAIGLEHEAALGAGVVNIAKAKAGIMKEGRPVVLAAQPDSEAQAVLEQQAAQLHCPVVHADKAVATSQHGIRFLRNGLLQQHFDLAISDDLGAGLDWSAGRTAFMDMLGDHQCSNAAAAITAALLLREQGWDKITSAAVLTGLCQAHLPGRFQVARLRTGQQPWVVLDGAHTPGAAAAFCRTVQQVFPGEPVGLVVGMASDKDHRGFLAELRQLAPTVAVFVQVPIASSSARSMAPGTLAAYWQLTNMGARRSGARCRTTIQASVLAAVDKAATELEATQKGKGVICLCGSLHLVAEGLGTLELQSNFAAG